MEGKSRTVYLILTALTLSVLLNSCGSAPKACPEILPEGNLGQVINTPNDEYSPVFFSDKLYFTTLLKNESRPEEIFISEIKEGSFTTPKSSKELPLTDMQGSGLPHFHYNKNTGIVELYFAAVSEKNGRIERDIFYSENIDGEWSKPAALPLTVNSEHYESHPSVSPDGKYLLFTSDRPGGSGDLDIWVSSRTENGWSEAVNAGPEINSPDAELTPYVNYDKTLYYSSKGFGVEGFDIIKAKYLGGGNWSLPVKLAAPINTNDNETGPVVQAGKLYFTSDREGGCGGKDIYAFDLCGPVSFDGKIIAEAGDIPLDGQVTIKDGTNETVIKTGPDGNFNYEAAPDRVYSLSYINYCLPELKADSEITTPCSDTSSVRLIVNILLPEIQERFTFEEYNVPFFVTGYYHPNTPDNLSSLKMKVSYNLLGTADSTRYIRDPGDEYDKYAVAVKEALDNSVEFINNKLNSIETNCLGRDNRLNITVTGYADPRPFTAMARYADRDIDDEKFGVFIDRGKAMTNELLSKLRAYFTAKYIEDRLMLNPAYEANRDKVNWTIRGSGVDIETNVSYELKRRVDITIEISG
ncbi:MAG: TolB family protein [Candidatus Kapaibacterium sp.]